MILNFGELYEQTDIRLNDATIDSPRLRSTDSHNLINRWGIHARD